MFWRKKILMEGEDGEAAGSGASEGDGTGEDTGEGEGDSTDSSGGEDTTGEGESDSTEGDAESSDSDGIDLSSLPAHIRQFAELDETQAQQMINNAHAFGQISQDTEFPEFFKRVVARISGLEVPGVSNGASNGSGNGAADVDVANMTDKDLLGAFVDERINAGIAQQLKHLNPLIDDFSSRKVADLKKEFPNLEKLMPEIAKFKNENPWAANAPAEHIIKILTHGNAGKNAIDKLKNSSKAGLKPRGGSPRAPTVRTKETIAKMSTLALMEDIAKEQGIKLE